MASKLLSLVEDKIRLQYAFYLVDKCIQEDGRKLNLSHFKLKAVPPALAACPFLSKLSLDGNLLPSESINVLQSFKFLRYLTLNDNELSQFPEELCQLKFVEFLNIGGNPMDRLPEAIGKMKNLITLWCNDMLLEQLPEAITTLRKLKTFGARNNQLTGLPHSFGLLRRLRWLTLENNHIRQLPESFERLSKLIHLNMKENQFNELPVQILQLTRLKFCSFENNLIEEVSVPVLTEFSFINTLKMNGNAVYGKISNFENIQMRKFDFELNLWDEEIVKNWEHSLPNSELNSPDTSDDELDDNEPFDIHLLEMGRFCCAV